MSRSATGPQTIDSSDRRDEIVEAAGRLFSESGYHTTSMRDLARAVNLQGGSLYSHITSKDEVLFEIVSRAADEFLAAAASVPAELSPAFRLARLIQGHLRVMAREIRLATVFFQDWRYLSPERREIIALRRDEYEAHFRDTIEAGAEAGVFHVESPRLAAIFVLSALNWTYQWYDPNGSLSPDELASQYCRMLFGALGGPNQLKLEAGND
ncbi:MAG TPA: TetR/AcrR family transcriptional regulator [Thermomicrobiaceae bacterium]|nr:TetR/AcrR family transcriptional regulator [Thermomicrobiaceae bacterium]